MSDIYNTISFQNYLFFWGSGSEKVNTFLALLWNIVGPFSLLPSTKWQLQSLALSRLTLWMSTRLKNRNRRQYPNLNCSFLQKWIIARVTYLQLNCNINKQGARIMAGLCSSRNSPWQHEDVTNFGEGVGGNYHVHAAH